MFHQFTFPQASEVALLTALFELFRARVASPEVTIGVTGAKLIAVRIKSSEISEAAVRTAYLDALEDAIEVNANDCNAIFDPTCPTRNFPDKDAEFLTYLLSPVPVANRLAPSDRIAVRARGTEYTYADLLDRAGRLASRLQQRGVVPGSIVAIAMDRCADLVIAIIAVWQTGAAYLPVDPAYPEERRTFLLEDSGAEFTVTERDFDSLDEEHKLTPTPVDPDSLAYLIYTSGSLGQPKGVPITHAGFANFIDSVRWRTGIGPDDRFVAVTTLSFDISAMELMLPLTVGATATVATREETLQGSRLAMLLKTERATMMFGTPATWRLLLDSGWQGDGKLVALCGGEELSRTLADRLLEQAGAVWNMFGPTETSVASTMARVRAGFEPVPIGRALARTQLHIEDGELWIAGAGLSPGYWNRPELTNEKFTADNYFRTGDLVRFNSDGDLLFLGRADEQVKIRGFRIEPGEIEAAILRFPEASQAAVLKDRETLRAFVCPVIDVDRLREQLARQLPAHMVPGAITALPAFPLLPNGKVDRRALLHAKSKVAAPPFEPPSGMIEKALAAIFEEVLHVPRVSATDNFFHLGGHSLLAGQVLARIWEMWRVELPARTLFETPSLRELAKRVSAEQGERTSITHEKPAHPTLSTAQQRLWFLHEFHQDERALYNIPATLRLSGPLDQKRLEWALNQVVARHEPLRSSFDSRSGETALTVHPEARVALPLLTEDEARREVSASFDLTKAPLLRASLVSLGRDQWHLFLTMHHIVSDGWSMGILFRELSELYRGNALPPISYFYSDYASEQARSAVADERHLRYWRSHLRDLPSPLELPADRPRGPKATYRGASEAFAWPANIGTRISAFSREHGVTPFVTLVSAFNVLLHRYTGETDVIIGTTLANRSRVETEPLIGLFVNTIPLRATVNSADSFGDVIRRTRDSALDGLAHGELPFQTIVEAVQPDRSLVHTPFFQVMFSQQNAAQHVLSLPGVTVAETRYDAEWVKLDLTINIEKIADGVSGAIDYNSDLFDRTRIQRLAQHLFQIADAALRDPGRAISEFSLLTTAEKKHLASWNRTNATGAVSFLSAFHRNVAAHPDRTAVECEGVSLTYAELDQLSDRPNGVPANSIIPLLTHRDSRLIPQLLRIWKRGSAYLPIDPEYPADRQLFMQQDVEGAGFAADLAYVIYTSGSTGLPKGVCIPRTAVDNLLEGMRTAVPVDEHDVMVALASAAFDMSVPELWLPLYSGAKLVLATTDDARNLDRLKALLERTNATVMQGTPTLWAALLDAGWYPKPSFKLLVGAEALPQSIGDRLAELPCTVWNMFGPTETTVWSTMGLVVKGPVTIGRAMQNTRLFVLDTAMQEVPIGNPGELYIAGEGVAQGYWNRPDLTAERFVTLANGERAFRTGDVVRFREDGQLEFGGRADGQVKLHGYRIELGEIEAIMERQPGVHRAAAATRERDSGDKYLAGYFTGEAEESSLRAGLVNALPPYMVPARFVRLTHLPLSANGKVDRRALPAPDEQANVASLPSGSSMELLQTIFASLLRKDAVGPDDSFFHLGGHSLLAARLAGRIRDSFQTDLSVRSIFAAPTPRLLAKFIEEQERTAPLPAIIKQPASETIPLSFTQERLWFLDRYHGGHSEMFHIAEAFRIRGPLDTKRLLDSLRIVAERHSVLRMRFADSGARIEPAGSIAWGDSAPFDPMDLTSESPLRARLGRHGADDHRLELVIHHIVSDAWSFGIIHRELAELYAGETLPQLPIQFSDFAAWQRQLLSGNRLEEDALWWKTQLDGAPQVLELPLDYPRPPEQSFEGHNYFFTLSREFTDAITRFTRAEDVTLYMVLLAAFQLLLARYTGVDDIVVGSPIANRTRTETESLVGYFANTLALRTRLGGDPTFRDLARRVRESALDAEAHQDFPFEKLVEIVAPERTGAYTPIFQVLFILENTGAETLRLPELEVERERVEVPNARYDITLDVEEQNGELKCVFNYSAALFTHARIERMAGHLKTLLTTALAVPETKVWRLPLLTEEEAQQFRHWNQTASPIPDTSVIDRIMAADPCKTAVICGDRSLTYFDLQGSVQVSEGNCLIPLVTDRDLDLIPKMLRIWNAGGAYVPIDPEYPAERKELIRSDVAGKNAANGLAYVIYTSGSSGKPKGVEITHRSLVNLLEGMRVAVPFDRYDVMIALASAAFDMSVPELWLPLYCGATLVVGTQDDARDPVRLRTLLETSEATVMQGTPTLWNALLDAGWYPKPGFKLLVGAEALPPSIAKRLAELPCTVWNMFGPTETTVWSTMARVTSGPVAIGRPMRNTCVHVLDLRQEPCPVGVPGELYISGAGVARGYWHRPELTNERFVPLPSGQRAYRTGDQVRYREDGQLEFIQRLDTQVKLRGYRVELGEIEAALEKHPAIHLAVAAIRGDNLYAWVTGGAVSESALRDHLMTLLPAYMVPTRIVPVDRMPLNANGKLDRKQLALPCSVEKAKDDFQDPLERQLLPIWQDVLQVSDLGPQSNFFHLGGHSLSAMRLVREMEKVTGQRFPIQMLFSTPTIRGVAQYLRRNAPIALPPGLIDIQARGAQPPIFFCNVRAGCWNLAHALGSDQPLLGVESGTDAIAAVRARLPNGPYRIAAYGDGVELAIQLATGLGTADYIVFLDPPVLPDFAGRTVSFRSNEGPVFESPAVERIAEWLKSA